MGDVLIARTRVYDAVHRYPFSTGLLTASQVSQAEFVAISLTTAPSEDFVFVKDLLQVCFLFVRSYIDAYHALRL